MQPITKFAFRKTFKFPSNKDLLHWFPGHMGKGLKQMKQKLKSIDCVVEVHDARIPISGRNPDFKYSICGVRPHLLILNKKDLADLSYSEQILTYLSQQSVNNVVFTNCKDSNCNGMAVVIPLIRKIISSSERYNRSEERNYRIMVTGVPNVGKSSFINRLRNKYLKKASAAAVGAVAGITRSVSTEIKVSTDPLIYILDTPGILSPSVPDSETGLKLALCSTMQDHLIGPELIADYLLYILNKNENFSYVKAMELSEPTDNIVELLNVFAIKMNRTRKLKGTIGGYSLKPDTEYSANYFLKCFRLGQFGSCILDKDLLTESPSDGL